MTNVSTPIEYFKKEAKTLFRRVKANDAEAIARVERVLKDLESISLMRVQHVIASEYGFQKWENLAKASTIELQTAIMTKRKSLYQARLRVPPPGETPLVSFLRGPGILPTPPHLSALADMFDRMTMEEQRRYLDEDARAMGLFDR